MGSADWMPRNLDRRVEIVFPLYDAEVRKQAVHILDVQLADNVKAKLLNNEGQYKKIDQRGKAPVNAQEIFCAEMTEGDAKAAAPSFGGRSFSPVAERPDD